MCKSEKIKPVSLVVIELYMLVRQLVSLEASILYYTHLYTLV